MLDRNDQLPVPQIEIPHQYESVSFRGICEDWRDDQSAVFAYDCVWHIRVEWIVLERRHKVLQKWGLKNLNSRSR